MIVVPQWGWPEYHADFTARQQDLMDLFFGAGADHVIGHGTHWASAIAIRPGEDGDHFVISSHGNFLFGQDWSRQTQEGVIVELTFVGTHLAQAHLHPYIMLDRAPANLVDPATDGKFVLKPGLVEQRAAEVGLVPGRLRACSIAPSPAALRVCGGRAAGLPQGLPDRAIRGAGRPPIIDPVARPVGRWPCPGALGRQRGDRSATLRTTLPAGP